MTCLYLILPPKRVVVVHFLSERHVCVYETSPPLLEGQLCDDLIVVLTSHPAAPNRVAGMNEKDAHSEQD